MRLPKGHTELSRDDRPIQALYWPNDETVEVGKHGCTRIEAYDECGSMSHVPWLAVFHDDHLNMRVPADHVEVVYTRIKVTP